MLKRGNVRKTLWKKVKLLKLSDFPCLHNAFYAMSIFKSFKVPIAAN